uniref:Uncharacterized protein n=1 Tax=Sciurus vulgaris TaxID=55149 RepID=A0A8D2E1K3_SCIVU
MPITGCASPAASTGRSSPPGARCLGPRRRCRPRKSSGAEDPTDPSPAPW